MSTTEKNIDPADGYVQISSGESGGSICYIAGGAVVFRQDISTPPSLALHMGQVNNVKRELVYFGLGSEKLYAKALSVKTKITVTSMQG
jgi:hypothetical protein